MSLTKSMTLNQAADVIGSLKSYITSELQQQHREGNNEVVQLFGETVTLAGSIDLLESVRSYLLHSLEVEKGGKEDPVEIFTGKDTGKPTLKDDLEVLGKMAELDPKVRKLIQDLAELVRSKK